MEIAIVLIVALIIMGPKKLPDMGRSLGKGMREFKGAISGDSREDSDEKAPRLTAATDAELVAEERERAATAA
jgi:sec-independent protein translocase protein TatA